MTVSFTVAMVGGSGGQLERGKSEWVAGILPGGLGARRKGDGRGWRGRVKGERIGESVAAGKNISWDAMLYVKMTPPRRAAARPKLPRAARIGQGEVRAGRDGDC